MLRDYFATLPLRLVIVVPLAMLFGVRFLSEWVTARRRRREQVRGFEARLVTADPTQKSAQGETPRAT
jgi:NADH:ubiquinone oxidoreductase subunit 3 (subunit A)